MYGRMQFADFVVSWALQALSRSLQKVSDSKRSEVRTAPGSAGPTGLHASDEKALILTAERIFSLWQMVQWSIGKVEFKRAQADLTRIIELVGGDPNPAALAAERLLERADAKTSPLLMQIMGSLTLPETDQRAVRDQVNELLQAESGRWREYTLLRQIDEIDLIEHGMLRAFEKASELIARLNDISADTGRRASAKRLRRASRWVHHAVNHLELLRPALSESGRTRRWHLNRLAAKLDEQWALEKLARAIEALALKPKASARLGRLVDAERVRLDKQRRKLSLGAFAGGSAAYRREVAEAVAKLGLEAITLLPIDGLGKQSGELR